VNDAAGGRRLLLLGEGAGIDSIVGVALDAQAANPWRTLVLLGAAGPFAFRPRPSTILVPGMPPGVIACLPRLDTMSIPSRLANGAGLPGCYDGTVIELAAIWLRSQGPGDLIELELRASGSAAFCSASAELARGWSLPCETTEAT
jgi:dihydroorotate dehydrogenase electron transfer subunit